MYITRDLPENEYQAAISANAPTALNPFATMADVNALAPTLLDVMNNGHQAQSDFGSNVVISSINNQLQINSLDQTTSFIAASSVHLNTTSLGASGFNVWALSDIAGIHSIKSDIAVGGTGTLTVEDTVSNKGFVYASDYSANFTALSLVDKGYSDTHLGGKDVTALITTPTVTQDGFVVTWDNTAGKYDLVAAAGGGNTLYTANDSLTANRTVTMATFDLRFTGTGEYSIGGTEAGSTFTVDGQLTTGFIYTFKRDFDAAVGQKGFKNTINNRGSEVRRVRTNGTAFSIWNEWTIGDNRKSVDFIVSPNNNYLSLYDAGTGLIEQVRLGDEISWWNADNKPYGFGFGHNAPSARTIHSKNMDVRMDGASLSTEFFFDYSANKTTIGSGTAGIGKFNVEGGQTVLNYNDSIDTLIIGNDTGGGAIRAGIIFNNSVGTSSRIYDRSDGTFNQGLTFKSRNNIFEFLGSTDSHTNSELLIGILSEVRTIRGDAAVGLILQGSIAPNDAADGVKIQTADAADAMQTRFEIEADTTDVKAYFNNITGLYVGGTGTPTSMLTVNGDVETEGSSNGIIFEDRTTGQRTRFYVDNGVFSQENA